MAGLVGRGDLGDRRGEDLPGVERLLGLAEGEGEGQPVYRIGDLASEFGVSLRSLRFYESRGLLHPERRGTMRLYSQGERRRLRLILLCKLLGFTLVEIRQIVESYLGAQSEQRRARRLRETFQQQRRVLKAQRDDLDASITALEASIRALQPKPQQHR